MRQIVMIILGLAIIAPVLFWFQGQRDVADTAISGAGIRLTNRPASFCPEEARVVAVKTTAPETVHFDGQAVIAGCDAIRLPAERLAEALEYQIFVLVDGAKAFRLVAAGPITTYIDFPIQVGDTNADNVINEVDLKVVQAALGEPNQAGQPADVDGDNKVTILDYSLVTTNQGAGAARPDGKLWEAL